MAISPSWTNIIKAKENYINNRTKLNKKIVAINAFKTASEKLPVGKRGPIDITNSRVLGNDKSDIEQILK